ncbi:hypothetical protein [Paenibacillus dokdonensis]|uniref:hypothetical protein n=1 Tax=Paenibacillus dokdonensis TaxID=2567944 RepID=UPI0010A7C013|nr:hypothetical protein [Paenibacillus dokdonensis]
MKLMKNFSLVVLNLVGEFWTGFYYRSSDFYDRHTVTKTKTGYIVFVSLAALVTLGIAAWLFRRIY